VSEKRLHKTIVTFCTASEVLLLEAPRVTRCASFLGLASLMHLDLLGRIMPTCIHSNRQSRTRYGLFTLYLR
jgi:hypothetical protein